MLNGAEMKLKVKFITKVSGKENSILLHPHENMDDFSDKVLLENSNYRNIFGKPFNESGNKPWKRGIVKISNGRRSTHLLFYSQALGSCLNFCSTSFDLLINLL